MKARGHKIRLVTARSADARSDTLRELHRMKVPFDTLDLAPNLKRDTLVDIANFKFEMRKK
jgi:hypothetical protein